MSQVHRITFANEKGGTGKSTTAVHIAIGLAARGARVACLDLDTRQRTMFRYFENRQLTMKQRKIILPMPKFEVFEFNTLSRLETQISRLSQEADFLIFDTPGRDDKFARFVATHTHTLVTPMNDSFVDLDLIGQVSADTYKVRKLSFYGELIWEARKVRAATTGKQIDWIVIRNRLHHMEAHNQQRVGKAMVELSKRAGFRIVPGLHERAIYRELFPAGLTLVDRSALGKMAPSHVIARQELRELLAGLSLPVVQDALAL